MVNVNGIFLRLKVNFFQNSFASKGLFPGSDALNFHNKASPILESGWNMIPNNGQGPHEAIITFLQTEQSTKFYEEKYIR